MIYHFRVMSKRGGHDAVADVDKMKERAAKNNTFVYIKVTQVQILFSYKVCNALLASDFSCKNLTGYNQKKSRIF